MHAILIDFIHFNYLFIYAIFVLAKASFVLCVEVHARG